MRRQRRNRPSRQRRGRSKPRRRKGPIQQPAEEESRSFTGEAKLLILPARRAFTSFRPGAGGDVWEKSGLTALDFSTLADISAHTLYCWRKKMEDEGPEGLFPRVRGPEPGSKVDAATRRAIVMLRKAHPEYGCQRISDILYRGPGLGVSPTTVARVLEEEGLMEEKTQAEPHPDKQRSFERAKPMQLWQSDLFTFVLKRQAMRVHLVAFLDDHSRFVTGFGLASRASGEFVIEVVRSAWRTRGAGSLSIWTITTFRGRISPWTASFSPTASSPRAPRCARRWSS